MITLFHSSKEIERFWGCKILILPKSNHFCPNFALSLPKFNHICPKKKIARGCGCIPAPMVPSFANLLKKAPHFLWLENKDETIKQTVYFNFKLICSAVWFLLEESVMMWTEQKIQIAIYTVFFLYKNKFIKTRGSFLLKIKNNPSLSRGTKFQSFNLRTNICSWCNV